MLPQTTNNNQHFYLSTRLLLLLLLLLLLFRDGYHFLSMSAIFLPPSIQQTRRALLKHLHHHPHVTRRLFSQTPEMPPLLFQKRLYGLWW